MKKLLGVAALLLGTALVFVVVLRIWGVPVLSNVTLLRSGASLAVLAGAAAALGALGFALFQNPARGYDHGTGQRAHPRRQPAPRQ